MKPPLTFFLRPAAAGNGKPTWKPSKEIAIIFDKPNCYRGYVLV